MNPILLVAFIYDKYVFYFFLNKLFKIVFNQKNNLMRFVKSDPILTFAHHAAVSYKPPITLTYFWNFGVLALFFLVIQLITGIFLAMHYVASPDLAFNSVEHIMRDINYG